MVRGRDGGIEGKLAENAPGPRRVTWIHRNDANDETGREEDPADTYDPRTRPWYEDALVLDRHLYLYLLQPARSRNHGIHQASRPNGRLYLFGVDIMLDALSHFLASLE